MKNGYFISKNINEVHALFENKQYTFIVLPLEVKMTQNFDNQDYDINDKSFKEKWLFKNWLNEMPYELEDNVVEYVIKKFPTIEWRDYE